MYDHHEVYPADFNLHSDDEWGSWAASHLAGPLTTEDMNKVVPSPEYTQKYIERIIEQQE